MVHPSFLLVLGILLEVDIACEPAFFLRAIQQPSTLSSVLDNLDVLVDSAGERVL